MRSKITIITPSVKPQYTKEEREYVPDSAIITPNEISELQGSLQELNNDKMDSQQRTSGIDLRSRLHPLTANSLSIIDSLIIFRFLPLAISPLCNSVKRLSVSLDGKGRGEIVEIVRGKREQDALGKGGFFGFGGNKESNSNSGGNQRGGYK